MGGVAYLTKDEHAALLARIAELEAERLGVRIVYVVWSTNPTMMQCFCNVFEAREDAEAYAKHRRGYPGEEDIWFVQDCRLNPTAAVKK